jgi:Cft2 family RNA processing exonuclease
MSRSIVHHGAVDGVAGSCHQLTLPDGASVLVDCGLFQGAETSPDGSAGFGLQQIGFDAWPVIALVVTHVHIDHVGRLPYLLAAGFKGPVVCSEASAELLPMVMRDALEVGFTRDRALIERVVAQLKRQIVPLPYRSRLTLRARFGCRRRVDRRPVCPGKYRADGYQAAGTPGRTIQTYGPRGGWVELDGQRITIRAGVHTLGGYGAHADQRDLLHFVGRMRHAPGQIRIVHADKPAKQRLATLLRREHPDAQVIISRG